LDIAPVNLHFEDSGEWYSLPAWAEYFIGIGKQIARADDPRKRLVTAIVVPTRAFGAAFVSLGIVISDAARRDSASAAAHFENLSRLPIGTPVVYRQAPGKTLRGVLQPSELCNGKMYIKVQVHSTKGGGLTHLVDHSGVLLVQPAGHSGKLPKSQGTENSRFCNQFVDVLLGEADPVQLGLQSKFCCAIIGKRNALEQEIRKTPLALHVNGTSHAGGMLQDILRVDRFVTGSQSHRSALVPVSSEPPPKDVIERVEMGTVFDGAHGFLKWAAMWEKSNQVVILDRTEPYFEDAVSAINSRFSQNRSDNVASLNGVEPPAGGEVLSFWEGLV